jgi:hypothetical protein
MSQHRHYSEVLDSLLKPHSFDYLGLSAHKDLLVLYHQEGGLEFSDLVIYHNKPKSLILTHQSLYLFHFNEYSNKPKKKFLIHQILGIVISDRSDQLMIQFKKEDFIILRLVKRAEFLQALYKLNLKGIHVLLVVNFLKRKFFNF